MRICRHTREDAAPRLQLWIPRESFSLSLRRLKVGRDGPAWRSTYEALLHLLLCLFNQCATELDCELFEAEAPRLPRFQVLLPKSLVVALLAGPQIELVLQ